MGPLPFGLATAPELFQQAIDKGPPFDSQAFRAFLQGWDIAHEPPSTLYPRSNGQVERTIQTVKSMLIKSHSDGKDLSLALDTCSCEREVTSEGPALEGKTPAPTSPEVDGAPWGIWLRRPLPALEGTWEVEAASAAPTFGVDGPFSSVGGAALAATVAGADGVTADSLPVGRTATGGRCDAAPLRATSANVFLGRMGTIASTRRAPHHSLHSGEHCHKLQRCVRGHCTSHMFGGLGSSANCGRSAGI
ncbi:uncharacterized protein LOC142566221 [Dermacentor variabilis]|uniref:uncharacterized protein LOC142566221 n=1 Tax=Dermacentor variabilis TaxID=34621 RepID=UPI003F5CB493